MTAETVINVLKQIFSIFSTPNHIHSDRGTSFIADILKEYLFKLGISSSHSTPYHPEGNSQCERYVGIIWKTIRLELAQQALRDSQWDMVINKALSSVRSLLCTATNTTPHERMFRHPLPNRINTLKYIPNTKFMYMRNFVRNKNEPLGTKVEILNRNHSYSEVLRNGHIDRISNNDLSPLPMTPEISNHVAEPSSNDSLRVPLNNVKPFIPTALHQHTPESEPSGTEAGPASLVRRSTRQIKPPDRLIESI
jgi:hypothetical protein